MGWGGGEQWGWCRPVDKIFYGEVTSNEYTDQMMPEAQVSWEGVGGEGGLGYLRLLFEHFEILDISQTFNLQM